MTQFTDLKLDPKVLTAIAEAGYTVPTPIQAGAIPPALEGRDVLGIAQTGTGKTASFTLPMITLLGRGRARARMPRSLVLCPTRELAAQVAENFDTYARHTRLTKALLIGGVSFGEQDKLIDRGVDVLIATPGRLLDHFERGKLLLTGVQIMVVDEADRMLDMGFIPDIERIFQLTPFTRQTLFFSATMAPEIERITNTFLHGPARIEVARQATASETITQRLVQIAPPRRDVVAQQKRALLRALIDAEREACKNAIIFCNRKTEVDIVAKSLKKYGYDAAPIHGDLDQSQRTRTLDGFRDGTLRLLVASDVAARGLDIPAVSHVFNFDLPSHAEDYIHRIGRTGRAGRTGIAISIGTPADDKYLAAIEQLVKQTLPRGEVPAGFAPGDAPEEGEGRSSARGDRDRDRGGRSRGRDGRAEGRGPGRREAASTDTPREPRAARAEPAPGAEAPAPAPVHRAPAGPPAAAPAEATDARREDRGEGRRDGRRGDRGDGRRDHRREDRGDDHRRDDRGDDNRRDDRRGGPAGLGDHVPDFMKTTFTPGYTVDAAEADAAEAETAAPPVPAAPQPEAEAPARAPRGRSRGRARSAEARVAAPEAPIEAPAAADEPSSGAQAADADAAPAPPAAPKPKRTRRKAAATDANPDADADADANADAPATARRRKAAEADGPAAEAADTPAAEAADTAAPRSRGRRKTAADADARPEAPAPKPRTRRKTAAAADAAAGTPTADAAPKAPRRRRKADAPVAAEDGSTPAP